MTLRPGWAAVAACAAALALPAERLSAGAPDPDREAVQAVCGRCHTIAMFQKQPRSWERWNDVFADMTQRGATGTDEQLERVTRYFLENLTLVNVNTSPEEELAGVLGVRRDVAEDLIARRERRRFANFAELRAVPGIDPDKLEQRKDRIRF